MRVFLCHSSEDKEAIRQLYEKLSHSGYDVWLDEENLLPGQDWNREIVRAVRNSDTVLICLSRNSITKSGFIQKEIKFALDAADEKPDGAIFLIPAKLEECNMPERLNRFQWVNLFESNGFNKLLKSLRFAESKGEESNKIAVETNTGIQTGISNLPIQTGMAGQKYAQEVKNLTVTFRTTGDREFDRKRIKDLYYKLVSYSGKDRFSFQIFENKSGHLIDFPEKTTQICEDLLVELHNILDKDTKLIIEKLTFQ